MNERGLDKLESMGMCPHGNFPSTCLTCAREKEEKAEHVPVQLALERMYKQGYVADERGFLQFDESHGDISFFERKLAKNYVELGPVISGNDFETEEGHGHLVRGLIESLGRVPSPAEVAREFKRQGLIRQTELDQGSFLSTYHEAEIAPQQKVIEARKNDFPATAKEFEEGPARIEEITGKDGEKIQRLIITTTDQRGEKFDHPVMTTEELNSWVKPSAEMIARSLKNKKGAKVFIAGLGLGLLNKELAQLGVKDQVVAELNHDVINMVGEPLQRENAHLEIRQGDFKQTLEKAVQNGEQFDAISIDAFPNTPDEVNRDASSMEVLRLAYQALKPGGRLTFYPDSRYIPPRVVQSLVELGIPESSIHYTMGKFDSSEFTHAYHYGDLMAIPEIQKPLLDNQERIRELNNQYYKERSEKIQEYVTRHQAEKLPLAA